MFLEALIPTQGLGNYGLWAKLGLLPGGVNKGSGDHTHDPLIPFCVVYGWVCTAAAEWPGRDRHRMTHKASALTGCLFTGKVC